MNHVLIANTTVVNWFIVVSSGNHQPTSGLATTPGHLVNAEFNSMIRGTEVNDCLSCFNDCLHALKPTN